MFFMSDTDIPFFRDIFNLHNWSIFQHKSIFYSFQIVNHIYFQDSKRTREM